MGYASHGRLNLWGKCSMRGAVGLRYLGFIHPSFGGLQVLRNLQEKCASPDRGRDCLSFDRILPDNFGMKAQQLVALMESTRRQALADPANQYAISSNPIVPE